MTTDRETLRRLIDKKSLVVDENFTLSTGDKSSFYFDCKKVTLDGYALDLIADQMLQIIDRFPLTPEAIGGLTMGADFIVSAVIMKAHQTGRKTLQGSVVRKEPKKHGTKNKIENELPAGTPIVVVDDVVTSGRSTLDACDEFVKDGYNIVGIIALVDREAGGMENIRKRYSNVHSLFQKRDFPRLIEELGSEHKTAIAG